MDFGDTKLLQNEADTKKSSLDN